ncbi:MAG: hypothetical protein J6D10_11340, partial [Clostridia bacterium]|nr:hypothetical protein [Clostridia bacterium]
MKKFIALILLLTFVLSLVGCSSKHSIPTLTEVSQMGYEEVNEVLSGRTINELRGAWGDPIDSDENGESWQVDSSMIITV